jgi:hypothetical protein
VPPVLDAALNAVSVTADANYAGPTRIDLVPSTFLVYGLTYGRLRSTPIKWHQREKSATQANDRTQRYSLLNFMKIRNSAISVRSAHGPCA